MELELPPQKVKKLRVEASALQKLTAPPSARAVSRLLGKMNSVSQATPPGPLFSRMIQIDLSRALERGQQDYESLCPLSEAAREELAWWAGHLQDWNGKSLVLTEPDIVLELDASRTGWGASCQGTRTGGPWSLEEKKLHINCLELMATFLALRTFLRSHPVSHVHLRMDNQTAVAYINNMGGTVSAQAMRLPGTCGCGAFREA